MVSDKKFKIHFDREVDGRWIADIPEFPGVMAYGATQAEAAKRVFFLWMRVIVDRAESGEDPLGEKVIESLFEYA